jgi:hypothetical protein
MTTLKKPRTLLAHSLLAAGLLLAWPRPSCADLVPILDINAGGSATVPLADAVGGWEFQVTNPLTLSALGVWDEGGQPLEISHEIGLWTVDQTLLATATVGNSGTPVASASGEGRWLFTPISPLLLQPGDYVLGAVWGDPEIGADLFRYHAPPVTSFGASFAGSRAATLLPAPILVFPNQGSLSDGIFGPNAAVDVPEPQSAFLLVCGGTAGLLFLIFWRAYVNSAWLLTANPAPSAAPASTSLKKCIPSKMRELAIASAHNSKMTSSAG